MSTRRSRPTSPDGGPHPSVPTNRSGPTVSEAPNPADGPPDAQHPNDAHGDGGTGDAGDTGRTVVMGDGRGRGLILIAAALVVALALAWVGGPLGSGDRARPTGGIAADGPPAAAADGPEPDDELDTAAEPDEGEGPGTQFARETGVSVDLALTSASIDDHVLDDGAEETVRFEFDDVVGQIVDPRRFRLTTADGRTNVAATSAVLAVDTPGEVVVGFPDGTDLVRYGTATARTDTVQSPSRRANLGATVELAGADTNWGTTSAPDLRSVRVDRTRDQISYRFDATIAEQSVEATRFSYHTRRGTVVRGARVVGVDGATVHVAFDDIDGDVARAVDAEAVRDRLDRPNPPAVRGDATVAPQLVRVAPVPGSAVQYDATFSQTVDAVDPGAVALYTSDGDALPADTATRVDERTVRLRFPDAEDRQDVVLAAAADNAAVRLDGVAADSTLSVVTIDASDQSAGGLSDGPDLVAAEADPATGTVRYRFDAQLDTDATVDAADFQIVARDGTLVAADEIVDVDGATVVVSFRATVGEETTFAVTADAVRDTDGRPNPESSVS